MSFLCFKITTVSRDVAGVAHSVLYRTVESSLGGDEMLVLFLAAFPSIKGFLTTPTFSRGYVPRVLSGGRVLPATNVSNLREFNSSSLESFLEQSTQSPGSFSLRLNGSRVGPTDLSEDVLANRNMTVHAYQITRPRWYNRAEATIIVLLVKRLQMLDVRGVEHMLESAQGYRKADPVSNPTFLH